jgi:hypothetical protein
MNTIILFQLFPASQVTPAFIGILFHPGTVTAVASHMSMRWQG